MKDNTTAITVLTLCLSNAEPNMILDQLAPSSPGLLQTGSGKGQCLLIQRGAQRAFQPGFFSPEKHHGILWDPLEPPRWSQCQKRPLAVGRSQQDTASGRATHAALEKRRLLEAPRWDIGTGERFLPLLSPPAAPSPPHDLPVWVSNAAELPSRLTTGNVAEILTTTDTLQPRWKCGFPPFLLSAARVNSQTNSWPWILLKILQIET